MDIQDKKFVFIGGVHRSGKSILFRWLTRHSKISGLCNPEANGKLYRDEGQHFQSVYPPGPEYDGPAGFDASAHLDETSELATQDHARRLLADWEDYWDMEKPVLLENSPPNLVRTRYLQSLFSNTFFIIVLRHPIPVLYEMMRWNADRMDRMLEHWLSCYETFEEDIPHLQNLLLVKYEDLASDPEREIERVLDFLGLKRGRMENNDVKKGENDKHFEVWRKEPLNRYNSFPIPILFRLYCYLRFESRVRRFGYSLFDLHGVQDVQL
ncbi:MAG: sulfotransferase [Salinibacter sp.]|uniref:sulfotransferase n=1 Tax=Salinibacter sp. TaxID=2065818 RepID=UPI0035D4AE69